MIQYALISLRFVEVRLPVYGFRVGGDEDGVLQCLSYRQPSKGRSFLWAQCCPPNRSLAGKCLSIYCVDSCSYVWRNCYNPFLNESQNRTPNVWRHPPIRVHSLSGICSVKIRMQVALASKSSRYDFFSHSMILRVLLKYPYSKLSC